MNITFIGNCQLISLCYYFQQLLESLDCNICWVLYGDEFRPYLDEWSNKVQNKIVDYVEGIHTIQTSDIIIYLEISNAKSLFCNTEALRILKKDSCKLIKLPYIYLDYTNYESSLKELIEREMKHDVDITVSDILDNHKERILVRLINHPTTFLFLEVVDKICKLLNIDTFSSAQRNIFLQDDNYMQLS